MGHKRAKGRRRAGFSLAEVLVAVVFLALIAAIGIPSLREFMISAEMAQLDNAAKQIYLAAQNRLVSLRGAGTLKSDVSSSPELSAIRIDTSDLVYADQSKAVMQNGILPVGSITDQVRGWTEHRPYYVVVFDKEHGLVQEVYYSERALSSGGTVDAGTLAGLRASEGDRRSGRVGYYNGPGAAADIVVQLGAIGMNIQNEEVLAVELTLPELPPALDASNFIVRLRVENAEDSTQAVEWEYTPYTSDFDVYDPVYRVCTKYLDRLDNPFTSVCADAAGVCPIPIGANINVSAVLEIKPGVTTAGVSYSDSLPTIKLANSHFATARTQNDAGKSYLNVDVSMGRHLSNLNLLHEPSLAIRGVENDQFRVKQVNAIDYGNGSRWNVWYYGRLSPMINNVKLMSYDGSGYEIIGMTMPLFYSIGEPGFTVSSHTGKWRVQYVNIVSPQITYNAPTSRAIFGVLACEINQAEIYKCAVYGEQSQISVTNGFYVGGLVGLLDKSSVIDSYVAIPKMHVTIQRIPGVTSIGGLVGTSTGDLDKPGVVSGCFVNIGELNANYGGTGMLIGYNWNATTIDACYTAGAITGLPKQAGGLFGVGVTSTIPAQEHVYDCYSLVDVSAVSPSAAYPLYPNVDIGLEVKNVYYLPEFSGPWLDANAPGVESMPLEAIELIQGFRNADGAPLFLNNGKWKIGGTPAIPTTSSLGSTYPYPGSKGINLHRGDWP